MITVTIESVSQTGAGVATWHGKQKLFVRGTWPGDVVRVQPFDQSNKESRYQEARLLEIVTPSVDRIASPCRFAGAGSHNCPCCPWIGIDYKAQLRQKEQFMHSLIQRLNLQLPKQAMLPIIHSPKIFEHRSRAQFKTNGKKIGYLNHLGNEIVGINDCPVLSPKIRTWLSRVSTELPLETWNPGKNHIFNFIDVDEDCLLSTDEMVLNIRRPFFQSNQMTNEMLCHWLVKHHERFKGQKVLELFAGQGNFTRLLLPDASHVYAAEIDAGGIGELEKMKKEIPKLSVFHKNLFEKNELTHVLNEAKEASVLLLNPPRDGIQMRNLLIDSLPELKTIIYLSCSPEKMLADAKAWEKRFEIAELQGVDQFPHTPHFEAVCLLERKAIV